MTGDREGGSSIIRVCGSYGMNLVLESGSRGGWPADYGDSKPLQTKLRDGFTSHPPPPVELFTGLWWIPGVDVSEHSSFWKEGDPAIILTDTAF